eukprot:2590255-Karenia_brevis.AAC.1
MTCAGARSKEVKVCKQCGEESEMPKKQVYCDKNDCRKEVQNAQNHAKREGNLEFFNELKNMGDPEPFRKYIEQFRRDMGPLQGGGKKRTGCFDTARCPVPCTNLRLHMLQLMS